MDELRDQFEEKLSHINGVEIIATPLYDTVVSGVRQELPVLFQVMGGKMTAEVERRPLNIAVVLDRSGSMSGQKLDNSKKAVTQLVSKLSDKDRLHFVIYDDNVETVLTNVSSATARDSPQQIDNVRPGGCTNLFAGVERGVELVKEYHQEGGIDAVFLFSDGLANAGITSNEEIGSRIKQLHIESGIRFTTFGIGSDFNEQLMSSIARVGKGNYFFIDDMERIPQLVQKAFDGFTNILANDLTFKVRGIGNNILYSLSGTTDPVAGKSWGMLREFGFYQILATASIMPAAHDAEFAMVDTVPILRWQLTYTDLQTNTPVTKTGTVNVKLAEGFESPIQNPAPQVVVYQTMLCCSELNETATKALRKRERDSAIKTKKEIIAEYEKVRDFDEYGFIAALLAKEKIALTELEREGITQRTTKMCTYTSSAAPGAKYERCAYEEDEEEDDDMGFGLFD